MKKTYCLLVLLIILFVSSVYSHDFILAPKLPNGRTLEPAGRTFDVGNMPLAAAVSADGKVALLLSGYREQGLQIVDPEAGTILQTLTQPSAFVGLAFTPDGSTLYASGAGENVIYEYAWKDGQAEVKRKLSLLTAADQKEPSRTPAGIALSKDNRYLVVAENLADTVAVIDLSSGAVTDRHPAGHFPYSVAIGPDGSIYVSAWGGTVVTRFRMDSGTGKFRDSAELQVGRHPSALLLNKNGTRLFVACGSVDRIAVIDTRSFRLVTTLRDTVPGTLEGSTPNALALSADQSRLYVAEADNNAVAVFQLSASSSGIPVAPSKNVFMGRIPAGWYPTAFIQIQDRLYVVNGKGRGTRANPAASSVSASKQSPMDYTLGQLNGTITELPAQVNDSQMASYSRRVSELNEWSESTEKAVYPPFKHVVYIIKENRTYDQVFGDVPQGDGDPSLQFFPASASPNHRALAQQFGLFDRFFVNAEVSSQGHPWSTSAYVTDFTEKTVHSTYSDRREGEAPDDEVSEPSTGYLWDLAMRGKRSLRIYGEYASLSKDNKTYVSDKKAAAPFTSPIYPSYNLSIQDQARADAWLQEFNGYIKQGKMPALEILHLPSDHTSGARAGMPTPAAYFADNDLALGRLIEALSASRFWKDTVVFVLEDDAQAGPDHVDSHRSVLLVISAYNKAQVNHRFVNTTDVLATIEHILGLGSLSQFDHFGHPLSEIFSETANLEPYKAIVPEQSLDEKNPDNKNARASELLKLDKEDQSDDALFNQILWAAIKGDTVPFPATHQISLQQIQQEQ